MQNITKHQSRISNICTDVKLTVLIILVSNKGYYLYVETSSPRKPGDKARLATFHYFAGMRADDFTCRVRFYYHMWGGDHIGNLSVKVRDAIGGPETTLWIQNGQIGNYWARADVVLRSTKAFQVRIGT